jgi:hypothetical protein
MPKIINEQDFLARSDVKAVMNLFDTTQLLQYCEIRSALLYMEGKSNLYKMPPIKHEVELVRILKRLLKFDVLIKSKIDKHSFYILNPLKYEEKFSPIKKRFSQIKKDTQGTEKEIIEYREQNMALILENSQLKERLAQYEGAWGAGPG